MFSILAIATLAGCLDWGRDERPDYGAIEDDVERGTFNILVQEHGDPRGHFDAGLHEGTLNLELVAFHNGVDNSGDPNNIPAGQYYTELAVTENYAYISKQGSGNGEGGGFSILDIRDPEKPFLLGSFEGLGGADIEVSHDEQYAFYATQRNTPEELAGRFSQTMDPRAGLPRGIYIVDIDDKTAPALANFVPLPVNGPHTLTYHEHANGDELLIACTYDLVVNPASGNIQGALLLTQRVIVYQFMRGDDGAAIVPVSQYQITDSPPTGKLYFPHDTRVQVHPVSGDTLLYVAYWDKGVRILDFNDPADPTEIGAWTEFAPSSRNNIHLAGPMDELVDGFHVTVTEPEIISADETGYFTFLDTTDPANPAKLGYWTLPSELIVQGLDFSPHNFDTFDGKLALAHNHAGFWVVDASDEENLREPKTVAYYMPTIPRDDAPRPQPYVWGVFERDGYLFVSDEPTGLHVLRYTGP